ncbi:hypothetical protein F3N42_00620 [Marinihelvus fidelis]|uniref:DUF7933 domain-containing protein n=1 Tax=Marinihelvus fidelis TaxID=2613842 RepID=A0A5N0TJ09_9GAMM|nr:hypothetical protein [Marinihelvus fidelis]KAA9134087.1 hypothetical protein F3N42_00620 [Marinihelvus fidelis]
MTTRILVALLALAGANAAMAQVELTCSNPTQSPDSTVSAVDIGTVITLSIDTTGAADARIDGVSLTPDVDPDANDNVTWTATHTAIQDRTIDVVAWSAGDAASVTCSWTIEVEETPPGFSKAFSPAVIDAGDVSTLTFTIDNSAGFLASDLDFMDTFPAGLVVAGPANASTTCTGGTPSAVAGNGSVGYTGGSVGDFAVCTVAVDVTSASAGSYVNTSGDLTSSAGNSGPATATLNVNAAPPPPPPPPPPAAPAIPIPSLDRIGLGVMVLMLMAFGLRYWRNMG